MKKTHRVHRDLLVRVVKLLKQTGNIEVSYNPEFGYELHGAASELEGVLGNTIELPGQPGPPDPPRPWPPRDVG